ncbi:MAG TPA: NifB/NifX family molybdenum-iron cluster-binding protein [Clostridia bacterium]|nr:NifB/NifX family molybdenum-iron cluster-binding protein [Clostridia bacterium]
MRIVIPICQGRISPVFDVASRFLLVKLGNQAQIERREVVLVETAPEGSVASLSELKANLVICGAISEDLQRKLEEAGITVLSHLCGEVESVLQAYLAGTLQRPEFSMPGCCAYRRAGSRHRCVCQKHSRPRKRQVST